MVSSLWERLCYGTALYIASQERKSKDECCCFERKLALVDYLWGARGLDCQYSYGK
jgi:hypothetical protein